MECDFTTWVTNCSPAGRGFLDCTGPFLLGASSSSSPLRPSRGNRFCRHFTWEGEREGGRACNDPPLPSQEFCSPASLPPQFFTGLRTGWKDTTTRTLCYLRDRHLLATLVADR